MEKSPIPRSPGGNPFLLKHPGGSLYLVLGSNEQYQWVDRDHVATELGRAWPDLETTVETKTGGPRLMRAVEAYDAYGTRVDDIIYSWHDNGPTYRALPDGGAEVTIRCDVRRDIPAEYNPDCEEWLRVVGGAKVERVKDWISQLRNLDEPCAALYLMGDPGFGKDMLAMACSKLFGEQVARYQEVVLSNFNAKLRKTPFVFLNEAAPAGHDGSRAFRDFQGGRKFAFSEKFKGASTVLLCPRCLICANNSDALRIGEEKMEERDEEAIAERILFVKVPRKAKTWLREKGGIRFTRGWVDEPGTGRPGKLVRHLQWIIETHELSVPKGRMVIDGDYSEWKGLAHERGGLAQDMLCAVAVAVCGDVGISSNVNPVQVDPDRGVWVISRLLARHWRLLTGKKNPPSYQRIGQELRKLSPMSTGEQVTFPEIGRRRTYVLEASAVYSAAEAAGFDRLDELAEHLGIVTYDDIDDSDDDVIH